MMRGKLVRPAISALLIAAAIWGARPAPADACGNEVYIQVDRKTQKVDEAERLLVAGRNGEAFQRAAAARRMPDEAAFRPRSRSRALHGDLVNPFDSRPAPQAPPGSGSPLDARAERVMAIAAARLDGRVDVGRGRVARSARAEQRRDSLAWALEVIDRQLNGGDDPVLCARRAEILARLGRIDEARAQLESLAASDLMPDAYGWAELARLRGAAQDLEAEQQAIERCVQTAPGQRARQICPRPHRRASVTAAATAS